MTAASQVLAPAAVFPAGHDAPRVLVLGIGNILLSDEGVGVRAIESFSRTYDIPLGISVLDGGTAGLDLIDAIADHDALIVVDAARLNRNSGAIEIWRDRLVTSRLGDQISPHQIGLGSVFAKLMLLDRLPRRITMILIEPNDLDLGLDLSPVVAARLDEITGLVAMECRALGYEITAAKVENATSRRRS